jgi:hypothetical protein
MDMIDGIIVGAAAAAIGSIIAYKFIERQPVGGASPAQPHVQAYPNFGDRPDRPLYVVDLQPTPVQAAPVVQVNPNQEAAFNQRPVEFVSAFGAAVNQPEDAMQPLPF